MNLWKWNLQPGDLRVLANCSTDMVSYKLTIATRWSGNVDYMTSENSVGINYRLVKLDQGYGRYEAGQQWTEPDIDQAADWMKKLSANPDLAQRIGRRGQQTIHANFSPEAVGKIIRERMTRIREQYR